jgi:DNA (cytosine-5)-methyltransferase 1
MINGLDLFSGIGGISLALAPWVRPIAYCENDRYAQAVLLSRMRDGGLPRAPIWDDVCTLSPEVFESTDIDIIYGGFPCQDISVAGAGAGLEGERSGLFFEIIRLTRECRPRFVFLENVPALAVRGLDRVFLEFAALGYDARWTIVSAAEMGAPHLRERMWILAHASSSGRSGQNQYRFADAPRQHEPIGLGTSSEAMADSKGLEGGTGTSTAGRSRRSDDTLRENWWATEPNVGRVAHGVPSRVDRIRGLGNSVCPQAAREAFARLMGISA